MFEYLNQIDKNVYERYLTAEKDIKSSNNSFYDSFLNLQENFLKTVVEKHGIEIGPHVTCGELLKRPEVKDLFLNTLGVDTYAYEKMGDYTKKANEHKHKKGKNIELDTVIKYMRVFYSVSSKCVEGDVRPFDEWYFKKIFGNMEKVEERLSGLEEGQQQILRKLDEKQSAVPEKPAERESRSDSTQTTRNFIARAEKKYNWFGTNEDFKKSRKILIIIQLALIAVGILSTVLSSVSFKLYSTFTLFENIVAFQTVILMIYALKTEKHFADHLLAKYNCDIFINDDGVWRNTNREKKRYKWIRRISYVCVIANIICIWAMGSGAVRVFATIFELAFLALTFASRYFNVDFYCMYNAIFISGPNASETERGTLVYDCLNKKLSSYKEYSEKYSAFI